MAKNAKPSKPNPNAQADAPRICKAEDCKKKPYKFGFCEEHYELYMAGVLRGDGTKPVDYDQKLESFLKKKQLKAA